MLETTVIPESTEEVIRRSTFHAAGTYVFVRAGAVRNPERHLMVTRDERETTVVTTEELLGDVEVLDRNRDRWVLLSIDCANPFYCVGFIARISSFLTNAGIDLLLVSTFTRDWIFVKEDEFARAAEVLVEAGLERVDPTGSILSTST